MTYFSTQKGEKERGVKCKNIGRSPPEKKKSKQ